MLTQELPKERLNTANYGRWERTATPVRTLAVWLHVTGCSLRETQEILRLFGVERPHLAIFQWAHRIVGSVPEPLSVQPTRVAVDEAAIKSNGEWSWLYAAMDIETKMILDVQLFGRRGTDPAAAFLHGLSEKHDLSETVFLVDGYGYQTALARLRLRVQIDYVERNFIKKWFQTLKIRVDCFHTSWVGSRLSARE